MNCCPWWTRLPFNLFSNMRKKILPNFSRSNTAPFKRLICYTSSDFFNAITDSMDHWSQHLLMEWAKRIQTSNMHWIIFNIIFFIGRQPQKNQKHIPSPHQQSSCKRLNMFLRWMVRDDKAGIDFGIWSASNQVNWYVRWTFMSCGWRKNYNWLILKKWLENCHCTYQSTENIWSIWSCEIRHSIVWMGCFGQSFLSSANWLPLQRIEPAWARSIYQNRK